jgi:energy-coupling factor transporter ATP-binding protein EcfA2
MKWNKLTISHYHQFLDCELNFTYPEGHANANRPLDRMCFIGQSGVGKTTVLRLLFAICKAVAENKMDFVELELERDSLIRGEFFLNNTNYSVEVYLTDSKPIIKCLHEATEVSLQDLHKVYLENCVTSKVLLLTAEMQEAFNVFVDKNNSLTKLKIQNVQSEIDAYLTNRQSLVTKTIQQVMETIRKNVPANQPPLAQFINQSNNLCSNVLQIYQSYIGYQKQGNVPNARNTAIQLFQTYNQLLAQTQSLMTLSNQLRTFPLGNVVEELYTLYDTLQFCFAKIPKEFTDYYQNLFHNLENSLAQLFPTPSTSDRVIDLSTFNPEELWRNLMTDISLYAEQRLLKTSKVTEVLSKHMTKDTVESPEFKQELANFRKWDAETTNPMFEVADCLNPILARFKVKVRTDLTDVPDLKSLNYIRLESLDGMLIPHSQFSTGTKQIVLTLFPLYKLKPTNSIILFDEPERSLYPDVQNILTEYYSNSIPGITNNQWFYASHSPILAGSFDPWEIIELRFGDDGKVFRKEYFENANNVSNYVVYPKYLEWSSIYKKVFNFNEKGNPERQKKLERLLFLKGKISANPSGEANSELMNEYLQLVKQLDWPKNETNK